MAEVLRAPSHTRLRARDHHTSSTLLGGQGGADPSFRFTLRSRDHWSMWMQVGCKAYMESYQHGIERIMFHGHLDHFQNPPLGGRPTTKSGDHGTPNAHNHRFSLFNHVRGPA